MKPFKLEHLFVQISFDFLEYKDAKFNFSFLLALALKGQGNGGWKLVDHQVPGNRGAGDHGGLGGLGGLGTHLCTKLRQSNALFPFE